MKFIVASIIGAVIGYITNWLAIKMLFRPHSEIRILGVKLPFTPGLIPKERTRIAKSVGETVGTHLLTRDDVINALCSPKMNKQLKSWVEKKVTEIKDSDTTIKDNLKSLIGNDYESLYNSINDYASNMIIASLKEESLKERLGIEIKNIIRKEFEISPQSFFENEKIKQFRSNIVSKIRELKDSPYVKERIEAYITLRIKELEESSKTLDEIIPQSFMDSVKVYIYNSRDEISESINEMLKQPDVEEKLKKAITSMIGTNLNPLVSMFINVDIIYDKLRGAIEDYLKDDENQRNIALLVNKTVDKITKSNVKEIIEKSKQGEEKHNLQLISDFIINNILSNEIIESTSVEVDVYFKRFSSMHEIISSFDKDYIDLISNFILAKLEEIIESDSLKKNIKYMVGKKVDEQLNNNLGSMVKNNEDKVLKSVQRLVEDIYQKFIDNEAITMVDNFNIPKIVEEKINAFDVAFAEKIIIDIAHKELSAITWLGALLGAIIGILSPILGSL